MLYMLILKRKIKRFKQLIMMLKLIMIYQNILLVIKKSIKKIKKLKQQMIR